MYHKTCPNPSLVGCASSSQLIVITLTEPSLRIEGNFERESSTVHAANPQVPESTLVSDTTCAWLGTTVYVFPRPPLGNTEPALRAICAILVIPCVSIVPRIQVVLVLPSHQLVHLKAKGQISGVHKGRLDWI